MIIIIIVDPRIIKNHCGTASYNQKKKKKKRMAGHEVVATTAREMVMKVVRDSKAKPDKFPM